jgi:hypothetical protein
MKPTIAKKCEATQALEAIEVVAPAMVFSSCQGRSAGYATNSRPARTSATAPARIRKLLLDKGFLRRCRRTGQLRVSVARYTWMRCS